MLISFLVITIIGFIYRSWFTLTPLSSGDWPYLFAENIKAFSWFPEIRFLWLAPYYQILTKISVQYLNIPWAVVEKIFWFGPFILISLFSSYKLTKSTLGSLIYVTNTYALMIVGGGQMGIALSYALAPLVLKYLIDFSSNPASRGIFNFQFSIFKHALATGLIIAIQMMFDPRIALLTLFASVVFYIFQYRDSRPSFSALCVSAGIAAFLNLYWIIPLMRSQAAIAQQLGEATVGSVKFLSFATFEQTISLLHPNWPENIFGKIHFMQPEFLFVAIIAFSSLFFVRQNRKISYFGLLALTGAFLAKGTNPPFGEIYSWFFVHVPGFSLFRDPTKFYLLTAISFSFLMPFVINKTNKKRFFSILFILLWTVTIREAFLGQLTGTFRPMPVPAEYVRLKDFLVAQPQFFDTFWIPQRQRFGYYSAVHPSVDAMSLSKESSVSGMLAWMIEPQSQKELDTLHVKYVIVPYDSREELFLTDRKYDEKLYIETMNTVASIPWVRKIDNFLPIGVFEIR